MVHTTHLYGDKVHEVAKAITLRQLRACIGQHGGLVQIVIIGIHAELLRAAKRNGHHGLDALRMVKSVLEEQVRRDQRYVRR